LGLSASVQQRQRHGLRQTNGVGECNDGLDRVGSLQLALTNQTIMALINTYIIIIYIKYIHLKAAA
jgi:hypothetical protein